MMTTLPFSSTGASQQGQSQAEIVVGGYPPGHCQEGNDQVRNPVRSAFLRSNISTGRSHTTVDRAEEMR